MLRCIATDVIAFLGQIEEFQKRVFEKRKFVLRTDYLLPISQVPRHLWPVILDSDMQVQEWKELFAIDPKRTTLNPTGELNEYFLDEHPSIVVNTQHFDESIKHRILAGFDDLEQVTDGVFVHGENYQALRLLASAWRERVKCTYIDPPYNTGNDEFLYKDRYRHSSWLSMLEERLRAGRDLLRSDGVLFVSIDDREKHRLAFVSDSVFGEENRVATFVWRRRAATGMRGEPVSPDHEYVIALSRQRDALILHGLQPSADSYPLVDGNGKYASTDLTVGMGRDERPGQYYGITNPRTGLSFWPSQQRVWRFEPGTMEKVIAEDLIIWPDDQEGNMERPRFKTYYRPDQNNIPVSTWIDNESRGGPATTEYGAAVLFSARNEEGGRELRKLLRRSDLVYPKPVSLLRSLVRAATIEGDWILDFFAGSGTTGQAVIQLNRDDGKRRKFILIDVASHFDAILVPRLKKVMYSPEWQDGSPRRPANVEETERGPRLVKVVRLESYEDALHNLTTEGELGRQENRAAATRGAVGGDRYRLSYLVRLPLEAGNSLLNTRLLEHPFAYTLEVLTDAGPRVESVDLVETFNYLAGLRVQRQIVWPNEHDGGREYRVVFARNRENLRVCVVWRDMSGLDPERERAFLEPQLQQAGPFDTIWINGDSAVPRVHSLDAEFARLMEEEEA